MDPLQILEAVNSFYEAAFSHLMTLTIAVLGISAVVIPLVWQIIQYRSFRVEKASLESQIGSQIADAKNEIKTAVDRQFEVEKAQLKELMEAKIKDLSAKMEEMVSAARAGAFFVQGANSLKEKRYPQATVDYSNAIQLYLAGRDEVNGLRALNAIVQTCVPQLNGTSFEQTIDLDSSLDSLVNDLTARNVNGRYSDAISSITKGRNVAKNKKAAEAKAT
jgi:hypothetical protein